MQVKRVLAGFGLPAQGGKKENECNKYGEKYKRNSLKFCIMIVSGDVNE